MTTKDPRVGVFHPVLPLDVLILKLMPKEGTIFMGVYPEGASIGDLKKSLADGSLPSTLISTRLRVMHQFGLAVKVEIPRSVSGAWQVTPKGEQFIADNTKQESGDEHHQ